MSAFTTEGCLGAVSSDQFNIPRVQWTFLSEIFSCPTCDGTLMIPKHAGFCHCKKGKLPSLPSPRHFLLSEHSSVSLVSTQEHPAGNPSPFLVLKTDALLLCSLIDLHHTLFNKRMEEIILPWFQCFCVINPVEWQHQHRLLHV